MIQHIYKIIGYSFLKCQRPFFFTKRLENDHGLTSGGVWMISHGVFYKLIMHLL